MQVLCMHVDHASVRFDAERKDSVVVVVVIRAVCPEQGRSGRLDSTRIIMGATLHHHGSCPGSIPRKSKADECPVEWFAVKAGVVPGVAAVHTDLDAADPAGATPGESGYRDEAHSKLVTDRWQCDHRLDAHDT